MKKFNEFELSSPGKPLVIISIVSWIMFVIGTFFINFILFFTLYNEYMVVGDLLKLIGVYSLIALVVFGFGAFFGVLIQKKKKIGLYGYTAYMLVKLYIVYDMIAVRGTLFLGGIGIVLFLFEVGIISKLWFSKSGKAWFSEIKE